MNPSLHTLRVAPLPTFLFWRHKRLSAFRSAPDVYDSVTLTSLPEESAVCRDNPSPASVLQTLFLASPLPPFPSFLSTLSHTWCEGNPERNLYRVLHGF